MSGEIVYCSRVKACGWSGAENQLVEILNPRQTPLPSTVDTCPDCGCSSFFFKSDGTTPRGWKPRANRIEGLKAEIDRLQRLERKAGM